MKMRFPVLFLGVLLAAFLAGAAKPGEPGSYPLRKLLTRGEGNAELGAVRVDRDLAVRGASQANSALFTPAGELIPFRFEPVMVSTARKTTNALGLASRPYYSSDRTPGVVFDNPSRKTIIAVELRSSEHDFDKLVRIESSEDGVLYRAVGPDQPVYDYSRVEASRRTVTFPPVSSRYLRVRVMDYPEEVRTPGATVEGGLISGGEEYARRRIRIDRFVALTGGSISESIPLVEPVAPLESSRREEGNRTVIEGRFEPEVFRLLRAEAASGKPFARTMEFYGSMDGKKYLFIGKRFGCCFDAPASGCQVELPVDARRFPFYRLVVDNGGSAPLETVRLLGCAERRRIVFESRAPELILAYGGEAAVVRPESRAVGEVNSYTAGPEEPNPAYETGGVNWVRWILAAAVGIMAVILVSLLWQGYQSIVK